MKKNPEIAALFERMGALLEIEGENVFRVRSYYKAAENIRGLAEDIADLARDHRLGDIPGIGKTLEEKIQEYLAHGRLAAYERLTQRVPETLLQIMDIPSVGPKKAGLFFHKLGVQDIAGLKQAAQDGRLLTLEGVRAKTVEKILSGIALFEEGQARMTLAAAARTAEEIIAALRPHPAVRRIEAGGSLRRQKETVRDIDLLVDSDDPAAVMEAFVHLPQVSAIQAHGETKSSILTRDHIQVDLRVVASEAFGAALVYFTGNKGFNVRLRQRAIKRGMKVSEYGVFRVEGEEEMFVAGATEEDCFRALDLPWIPPELREEIGEERIFGETPVQIPRLVEQGDIQGDLHVHSQWSDGAHTIPELAEAARARGYRYLAVSDHSVGLKVAHGVSVEDLDKKRAEIDAFNAHARGFRLLMGTEVEIDTDGALDYNEKILSGFDVVIAAIHSGFDQSREVLTRRLIQACRHPYVHIIAHPTGVHIGKRAPYDVDFRAVCEAAAETGTVLEINSFPVRMDLNAVNADFARGLGVKFAVNTDAHRIEHMDFLRFGIGTARRGWLTPDDIINTRPWPELKKILKQPPRGG